MSIDFRTIQVKFDQTDGGIQNEPETAVFKSKVRKAGLAINGFDMYFTNGDHNFLRQMINIRESQITIKDATVKFTVDFLIQDNPPIDNPYKGWVDVLVIADVE
jgi:hypothetical protein